MEVKVLVEGLPRVVCGLTEQTSCQEVVLALAQALSRPGRYTLQEKFKDFERNMSPSESLLESLQKYGEHVKDVQLTLFLKNRLPLLWDTPAPSNGNSSSRTTDLREPVGPPLRRRTPDQGSMTRKGSGSLANSAHRKSLPVLSRLRREKEEERPLEEVKKHKRKSLTLMDAWGWLGSLGRGRLHYSVSEEGKKTSGQRADGNPLEVSVGSGSVCSGSVGAKEEWVQEGFLSRVRRRKREKQSREHRTSCCIGNHKQDDDGQGFRKSSLGAIEGALWRKGETLGSEDGAPGRSSMADGSEDEKNNLREHIMSQGAQLRDINLQMMSVDSQIRELEGQQEARQAQLESQRTATVDAEEKEDTEQVLFWEKELKEELGYGRNVQAQFLEMRDRVWQCKAELEEYKCKMQQLDFTARAKTLIQETAEEEDTVILGRGVTKICTFTENSDAIGSVNTGRKETPSQPHAPVPPNQIKERRLTGPTELREWWTRWSETQATTAAAATAPKTHVHRSELTIYLGKAKI